MATFLHLLAPDSAVLAGPAIARTAADPGARVTVVLLGDAAPPALPAGIAVRHLRTDDLDYPGLLELIFDADHVISW
jgi:hypothetical protein